MYSIKHSGKRAEIDVNARAREGDGVSARWQAMNAADNDDAGQKIVCDCAEN